MKVSAIIAAAGLGKRMGRDSPKQYLELVGRPIICHTLDKFRGMAQVIIVVEKDRVDGFRREILEAHGFSKGWHVVAGGEKRQDSVRNGLGCVSDNCDVVLIHDGVRPFIAPRLIAEVADRAQEFGAAIVAIPVKDTIKKVERGDVIVGTVDRQSLWRAQTPQAFRLEIVRKAFDVAYRDRFYGTDEASLVERLGLEVAIVSGEDWNFKITTPDDLMIAEALLEK